MRSRMFPWVLGLAVLSLAVFPAAAAAKEPAAGGCCGGDSSGSPGACCDTGGCGGCGDCGAAGTRSASGGETFSEAAAEEGPPAAPLRDPYGDIPPFEEIPGPPPPAPETWSNEPARVSLRADWWYAVPRGEATAEVGGGGDDVDLGERHLVRDYPGAPWGEIAFRLRDRLYARFHYFEGRYHAESNVDELFTFDGAAFPAGTTIDSTLHVYDGSGELEGIFLQSDHVQLGFPFGLRYNSIRVRFSPQPGTASSVRVQAFQPFVGLSMNINIGQVLTLYARTEFFAYSLDDLEAGFFEFDGGIAVHFGEHMGIRAGFRYLAIGITRFDSDGLFMDDDKDEMVVELLGPYGGLFLRF